MRFGISRGQIRIFENHSLLLKNHSLLFWGSNGGRGQKSPYSAPYDVPLPPIPSEGEKRDSIVGETSPENLTVLPHERPARGRRLLLKGPIGSWGFLPWVSGGAAVLPAIGNARIFFECRTFRSNLQRRLAVERVVKLQSWRLPPGLAPKGNDRFMVGSEWCAGMFLVLHGFFACVCCQLQ